jgi:hypothetical protein
MRSTILLFFISALSFVRCDKQAAEGKKLHGEWKILSYSKMDNQGLIEYAGSLSGTMTFDKLSADSSTYSQNIICTFPSSVDTFVQNGTFKMTDKGDYMFISKLDPTDLVTSYLKYRILIVNKTDLEFEFTTPTGYLHTLIFEKMK